MCLVTPLEPQPQAANTPNKEDVLRNHLVEMLKQEEGFRDKPYRDKFGTLTIGWGHNLDHNALSQDEAELLLRNDIDRAIMQCVLLIPEWDSHDEVRQAVLADMMFNMGPATMAKFVTTLAHVNRKEYGAASEQMLKSLWAQQVGPRATKLARMMESGLWEN
jgi:lysozyme